MEKYIYKISEGWSKTIIEKFKLIKDLKHQIIYINKFGTEVRTARITNYDSFHYSVEEAKQFKINKHLEEIKKYESIIKTLKERIEKIENSKEE